MSHIASTNRIAILLLQNIDIASTNRTAPFPSTQAGRAPTTISGGHRVYGLSIDGRMGYRNDSTSGVAVGDAPETIYMLVDGQHYNDKCCFDFGNAETNNRDDGKGTMEAVYWGTSTGGLFPTHKGTGKGPWVMACEGTARLWSTNRIATFS